MNATPADVPFVWIALLVVSAGVLGVVLSLPDAPPPDADRVAVTVDEVAATEHAAAAVVPIDAASVRLAPRAIALRDSGGTAHTSLHFGPVTPVSRGSDLAAVARGTPPETVYESSEDFERALERARSSEHSWEPATGELHVRRVTYEEVEGVLVGQ